MPAAVTYTFAPNTLIQASQANTNFADLVNYINTNAIVKDASLAFTAVPSGPATDPSAANHLARKAYVDAGGTTGATVNTSQTTTSVIPTFVDLATVGPTVTMTPPASGKVKVSIYSSMENNGSSGNWAAFALSGGNTLAASTVRSVNSIGSDPWRIGATFLLTGLAAVSTTFTMKYGVGGGTGTFADRHIVVEGCPA